MSCVLFFGGVNLENTLLTKKVNRADIHRKRHREAEQGKRVEKQGEQVQIKLTGIKMVWKKIDTG